MKKILAILLCMVMMLSVVACNGTGSSDAGGKGTGSAGVDGDNGGNTEEEDSYMYCLFIDAQMLVRVYLDSNLKIVDLAYENDSAKLVEETLPADIIGMSCEEGIQALMSNAEAEAAYSCAGEIILNVEEILCETDGDAMRILETAVGITNTILTEKHYVIPITPQIMDGYVEIEGQNQAPDVWVDEPDADATNPLVMLQRQENYCCYTYDEVNQILYSGCLYFRKNDARVSYTFLVYELSTEETDYFTTEYNGKTWYSTNKVGGEIDCSITEEEVIFYYHDEGQVVLNLNEEGDLVVVSSEVTFDYPVFRVGDVLKVEY